MREIKFRAWDKQMKKMWYGDAEAWLIMPSGAFYRMEQAGKDAKVWPDMIPMQYTGLKDKNGKEIYEGDIVKAGKDPKVCKVIFENGCFYTPYNESKYRIGGWINKTLEVIGNIYSNPELLNQK